MKRLVPVSAIAGLLIVAVAVAQPAPWYRWKSTVDGATFCAQTSPGSGWVRESGPYRDGRCERLVGQRTATGT